MDLAKIILPRRRATVSPIRSRPTIATSGGREYAASRFAHAFCHFVAAYLLQRKASFFFGVECGELLRLRKYPSGCRWVLSNSGKRPTNLRQVALPTLFVILLPFVCSSAK